jgi:multidrug efflux pump subunit AcrB
MIGARGRGGNGDGPPPGDGGDRGPLERFKEFGLTSLAVRHRISVVVLFVLVAVAGVLSYRAIPKESFPEIEIPMIAVNTIYPGVSPEDMESLVTRPLEDELNTIPDLEELSSTSVEGYSSIVVEFSTDVDLDDALQKVREKVDLARPDLPEDAEDPSILEFNVQDIPVMQVNLSGEYGLVRLKELGEELQERLEQIPQVLRVELRGGLERIVRVDVSLSRLKFYGLTLSDIIAAIQSENVNVPGGSIDVGARKYLVRVDGEFEDPSVIEGLVVSTDGGRPVYVRDVADVEFGFEDRESFARLDGTQVVTLDVVKRSGENIIETSDRVKDVIERARSLFPPSTVIKVTSDQSEDIHEMVSSLENNIVSGLLLILAVLFFFLGLRTSVFVAVSIPTSMLLSFVVLWAVGISMNMVVLFSLILALGMLVDNAIVVVENIYRYVEEGWEPVLAARKATGEVAVPVVAATLTTLAAFAPMMLWPGTVGEFMKYLPFTLIVTLSSSLFVALVIVPTLCAMFLRREGAETARLTRAGRWALAGGAALLVAAVAAANPLTAGLLLGTGVLVYAAHHLVMDRVGTWFQHQALPRIVHHYGRMLEWALAHRLAVLGGSVATLVVILVAFGAFNSGLEFFPEGIPPSQATVSIEAPVGSRAQFTDGIARRLERQLEAVPGMSDAESVVSTVGGGGGGMMGGGPSGPEAGRVTVSFTDYQDRSHDSFETLAELQRVMGRGVAGAEISVDKPQNGPPSGPPVNLEIVGEDPEVLQDLSDRVIHVVENAPVARKLVGLESDLESARPELSVRVDREKAALHGLSTATVGQAVRGAIQGIEAAKYRTQSDEYDIVVRLAREDRKVLSVLEEITVESEDGDPVPLLSVARWEVGEGYGTIRRKDLDRMATVSSEVKAGFNSNAVLAEVRTTLADLEAGLPAGYTFRYTGQSEDQSEAQGFLSGAFLTALMLIVFILISQFNSVTKPAIIMTSVLLSTGGVLLGLMIFRMPFGIIMTGVGIISLAGIVVNNAIVLIDYIDILRTRDGLALHEALVQGGRTRFRPVVLTAVTTALGLVPLAVGLNFDFFGLFGSLDPDLYWGGEQAAWWGPMAIAVIAGIVFATFLTLVLVPVMYSLAEDAVARLRGFFLRAPEADASTEPDDAAGRDTPDRAGVPSEPRPDPAGVV